MLKKGLFLGLVLVCSSIGAATLSYTNANSLILGESGSNFGYTLTNAGDINGDGKPDVLFGAPQTAASGSKIGKSYIFLGLKAQTSTQNSVSSPLSIRFVSSVTNDISRFGKTLAANGDLDGDGKNDFVVGFYDLNKILVYMGSQSGGWTSTLNQTQASTIMSSATSNLTFNFASELPSSMAMNGDINGDGYSDLVIGASTAKAGTLAGAGKAFVLLGRPNFSTLGNVNLDAPSSTQVSFVFHGVNANDNVGHSVAILPDINGDGIDDVAISSYTDSSSPEVGRRVYLFYGRKEGFTGLQSASGVINVSQADAIFYSPQNGSDGFGEKVVGLGDINHDGYGDFAITAPNSDSKKGWIYIYFGNKGYPFTDKVATGSLHSALITGVTANQQAGLHAVAPIGDQNGDGYADLVLGEYQTGALQGQAYVFSGQQLTKGSSLTINQAKTIIKGLSSNDKTGFSVSALGDLNNDGRDDFGIGIPGYQNGRGAVGLFLSPTNVTPSVAASTIQLFKDSAYSQPASSFSNLDVVYIKLSGATGGDTSTKNTVQLTANSSSSTRNIRLNLYETGANTNVYQGVLRLVRSRHSQVLQQVSATINDTITLKAYDAPSVQNTFTITNALPWVQSVQATQTTTGNPTKVQITFTSFDYDKHNLSFSQSPSQVQFLSPTDNIWKKATLSGQSTQLTADENGVSHTSSFQPLTWQAGQDGVLNGSTQIRLKPYDGSGFSSYYATSNVFNIDNTPPNAPTLSNPGSKFNFYITATGNAEALSKVFIYVSDTNGTNQSLAATGTANASGLFSIGSVNVSASRNRIVAVAQDRLGLRSTTSNAIVLSFTQLQQTLTHQGTSIQVSIPLNASPVDKPLVFSVIPTTSYSVTAPTHNRYVSIFNLSFQNTTSTVNFFSPVTLTLNLPQALTSTAFVKVLFLEPVKQKWVTAGITVLSVTSTQVTFKTTHFSTFAVFNLSDTSAPTIQTPKLDGMSLSSNQFYSKTPLISAVLQDPESGISQWTMQLKNTATNTVVTQNSQTGLSVTTPLTVSITPSALADGTYALSLDVSNIVGLNQTYLNTFKVDSSQFIFTLLAAPNPYNPDKGALTIGYNLSKSADKINFYLVNLRGDTLYTHEASSTEKAAGPHIFSFTPSLANAPLPNGVYFLYAQATSGSSTQKQKFKLAVLR